MFDDQTDSSGHARRTDGTFSNTGAGAGLGSQVDQKIAGVGADDNLYSATDKMMNHERQRAQFPHGLAGPMVPISIPPWLLWVVGACIAVFMAWIAATAWTESMSKGVAARGRLLTWAAGDSLGPLVDLAGAWEGAVGRSKPPPALSGNPVDIARRLQEKRLNFVSGRGPAFLDDPEAVMLQGAALSCLSTKAVQCLQTVATEVRRLDDMAIAKALALGVPWTADFSALPVLLSGATMFAEFELRKSGGPLRGDIDIDRTQATLLALCLRRTVYQEALTPAQCRVGAQQTAAKHGAPSNSKTIQRIEELDNWRWRVVDFVYRQAPPEK